MLIPLVYGTISVLVISLVGLVIVIFLPCLQHDQQSNLSQLFVGLAIGTLTSDALLHLLPHAFSSQADHHTANETDLHGSREHHTESDHSHHDTVWFGLMALTGMIGFLLFERLVMILRDLAHQHSHSDSNKIQQCAPNSDLISPELEKLNHKNHDHDHEMTDVHTHKVNMINGANDVQVTEECHRSTITFPNPDGEGYMHLGAHHHHHHKAHQGPSAAMMVLAGDILHNLFDGLAIGVAFSSGISGGLSTSLAVLCHELPHELGDFTIIIRSGMTLKRAVTWNIAASVICWCGMCLGLFLGSNMNEAWLSAMIAGTFLYIALVDMVPELDSCPHLPSKNRAIKLTVQLVGLVAGVSIMLVISLYEENIKTLFIM